MIAESQIELYTDKIKMMKEIGEALKCLRENSDPNFMSYFNDNDWRIKNGYSPLDD